MKTIKLKLIFGLLQLKRVTYHVKLESSSKLIVWMGLDPVTMDFCRYAIVSFYISGCISAG